MERFESWKQIAAYLGKSERTVQRWVRLEGLPVHRHVHAQRGTVWAYREEVDNWLAARTERPTTVLEAPQQFHPVRGKQLRWAAALLSILLLFAVLLRFDSFARKASASTEWNEMVLTSLPGVEAAAEFSPVSDEIAFWWADRRGKSKPGIFRKTLHGDDVFPIVHSGARQFDYNPTWSPDGKSVAYLRRTEEDKTLLMVVPASGGDGQIVAQLTAPPERLYANFHHVSWWPDGRSLVAPVHDHKHTPGIYRVHLNGEMNQLTTAGGSRQFSSRLSPKKDAIAFLESAGTQLHRETRIMRQALQKNGQPIGSPVVIYKTNATVFGISWDPTGTEMVMCKAASFALFDDNNRMYRLDAKPGSNPVEMPARQCDAPQWVQRPNGESILAYGLRQQPNRKLFKASPFHMEQNQPIAPSSAREELPTVSPDGKRIAFISTRSGRNQIWISDPAGDNPHRLTDAPDGYHAPRGFPRWSHDSQKLLYFSQAGIFVISPGGDDPLQVQTDLPGINPSWSSDGNSIFYSRQESILRLSVSGGKAETVVKSGYPIFSLMQVPGSEPLLYTTAENKGRLYVHSPGVEQDTELARDVLQFWVTRKYVYVLQYDQQFWRRRLPNGPNEPLGRPSGGITSFSVAIDDSHIIWSSENGPEADIRMVRMPTRSRTLF